MTILIGTKRETFAVIAADRLWHGFDEHGQQIYGSWCKLVAHPSLPLVVGSAGFARLPPDGERLPVLLEKIIGTISKPTELTMAGVMKRLEDDLRPRVRAALADPNLYPAPEKNKSVILVALATRRRAELGRLELADLATRNSPKGAIDAPESLGTFFSSGPYGSPDGLYGARLNDPRAVAEHLRRVVQSGITAEQALYGGENREVGAGVDVSVVDSLGARLV